MNLRFRAVFAAFLAFPVACASAQDTRTPVLQELPPVKVHRKTNPGDLPYKDFLYIQNYVQSLLPERRRAIDVRLRVNFASDKGPDYDRFEPKSWAVAIVGDTTDHVVPVTRGGYFLLPELREAVHENATIMFNTPTREGTHRPGMETAGRRAAGHLLCHVCAGDERGQVGTAQDPVQPERPA